MITAVIFDIDGTLSTRSTYMPRPGERPFARFGKKVTFERFVGKSAKAEIS